MTHSETPRVAVIAVAGRDTNLTAVVLRVLSGAMPPETRQEAEPAPKGPLTQAIERVLGDAPASGEVSRTHYAHVRGKEPFDPYGIFNAPGQKLLRGTW